MFPRRLFFKLCWDAWLVELAVLARFFWESFLWRVCLCVRTYRTARLALSISGSPIHSFSMLRFERLSN